MKLLNVQSPKVIQLVIAAAFVLYSLSSGCSRTCDQVEIPKAIGLLNLVEEMDRDKAREVIDRLHGKGVAPTESRIGTYKNEEESATLYVSAFSNETEAKQVRAEMAARIAEGNPVFDHYKELTILNHQVAMCLGMGQVHYFFERGNLVYWLGVDLPIAKTAIEDLIGDISKE